MSDFSGEINLNFKGLEKLIGNLKKNIYVDVGILGNETREEDGFTLPVIGAVHEFGNGEGTIPERSFIRMPLTTKQESLQVAAEKVFAKKLETGDVKGIFKVIGIAAEAAIQEAFETGGFGTWPDIEQETKDRKGSDAILIDTGTLRKGISSKVGGT